MNNTKDKGKARPQNEDIRARHLKRQKKKRKRKLFFRTFLLLVVLGIALFVIAFLTPWFNIAEITVTGNEQVLTDSIIAQSGIYPGNNIFKVSTSHANAQISSMPYVKSVTVKRQLPNKIHIEVQESHMAAYLPYGGGYVILDEAGKVLSLEQTAPEGYMQIMGCELKEFKIGQKIKVDADEKFDIILLYIGEFERAQMLGKVTQLDVTNTVDVKFKYEDRLEVFCGESSNLSRKLLTFAEVANNQLSPNARGEIDLRTEGKAYYRP